MTTSSIAPWLTVPDGTRALTFYGDAFGAKVVYRLENPEAGVVARLAIGGAEFWVSDGAKTESGALGGETVRMILTVSDPDAVFQQALAAGAAEVYPVAEGYGWKVGRLIDPFGLHWEIGRPLPAEPRRNAPDGTA